jgi:membrane protease YdiL (CAAX protease family)
MTKQDLAHTERWLRPGWRFVLFILSLLVAYLLWELLWFILVGTKFRSSFLALQVEQASFLIPTLVVIFVLVCFADRRPWSSLGLRLNRSSGLAFLAGCLLGAVLASNLLISVPSRFLGLNTAFSLTAFLLGSLTWLGAAATEELIFRGYLLQFLESGLGVWPAVVISSVLFGVLHLVGGNVTIERLDPTLIFIEATLLGTILAISYVRSRTLWLSIGLHFANNFVLAQVLSTPAQIVLPNEGNVLNIDTQAQLLNVNWPIYATPRTLGIVTEILLDFAVIILLLIWRFKREEPLATSQFSQGGCRS